MCYQAQILLVAVHHRGKVNVRVDRLSRWKQDHTDIRLAPKVFNLIDRRYGPHSVDLFATWDNNLLNRFVSWRSYPSAIAVDAFMLPLKGELLPSRLFHPSATLRGAPIAGDNTPAAPNWQAAWRLDLNFHRSPSQTPNGLHVKHRLDPPKLETDLLQGLKVVCQALGRPQGYIDLVVRLQLKKTFATQWKHYKEWCLEEGLHPWLSFDCTQVTMEKARDQLMAFWGYIKPSMRSYFNFCNHKSAVAKGFRIVFGFELGMDAFLSRSGMKGWKIELPPQPRHDPDEDGWDVGSIV